MSSLTISMMACLCIFTTWLDQISSSKYELAQRQWPRIMTFSWNDDLG